MLTQAAITRWYIIHKWTSLVCTVFMLLLCITGLPLIFHHEIHELEHWLSGEEESVPLPPGTSPAALETVMANALAVRPGDVAAGLFWQQEADDPLIVATQSPGNLDPEKVRFTNMDPLRGGVLEIHTGELDFMDIMFRLHVDLFAGLPGMLFLGVMGILLVLSIISGVVLYAPFMRKLKFGTVRRERSPRVKWLDLHNLLGIATLCWLLVVGATGVINTWATLLIKVWQADQLATIIAPFKNEPVPTNFVPLDKAVQLAREVSPDTSPSFVVYPGYFLQTNQHHIVVLMSGKTPLTSRMLTPVLIHAGTGELTATLQMPWYMTALLLSQPLHFGDYGGLPLKILWALLDIIAIIVLVSGLQLWWLRRRRTAAAFIESLREGELRQEVVA